MEERQRRAPHIILANRLSVVSLLEVAGLVRVWRAGIKTEIANQNGDFFFFRFLVLQAEMTGCSRIFDPERYE